MSETLIRELREGLCVEDQRCKVRNAESGCDCARIADYIENLTKALRPFANRVYNDNGDVTYDTNSHETEDYWRAYCALRRS